MAIIEIDRYEAARKERDDIEWLREASERACLSRAEREALLARARAIDLNPISRACDNETGGRPTRTLALALTQHLKCAGFRRPEICQLMDAKSETIRGRYRANDRRSLSFVPWQPRPMLIDSGFGLNVIEPDDSGLKRADGA